MCDLQAYYRRLRTPGQKLGALLLATALALGVPVSLALALPRLFPRDPMEYCCANLRGILGGGNVYANDDGDDFPCARVSAMPPRDCDSNSIRRPTSWNRPFSSTAQRPASARWRSPAL